MVKIDCHTCDATGGWHYSCCGDEFEEDPDWDICPTCGEHCGEGDFEPCPDCNSLGYVVLCESKEEYEQKREKQVANRRYVKEVRDGWYKAGIKFSTSPPRDGTTVYWNTVSDMLWRLDKNSWIPVENQIDIHSQPILIEPNAIAPQDELRELLKKLPNEQKTTSNTDEPLQDYSIFKS